MPHRRLQNRPLSEINVVPYIDVMLVLLVIFVITAPLLTQGVQVELPKTEAKAIANDHQEPIIVSVDQKGRYYLNIVANPDKPVTPHALAVRVAAELRLAQQEGRRRLVLVKGDRRVNYAEVMQAMVLLQRAGATSVGLLTEPGSSSG